jgi:hypothetical protein
MLIHRKFMLTGQDEHGNRAVVETDSCGPPLWTVPSWFVLHVDIDGIAGENLDTGNLTEVGDLDGRGCITLRTEHIDQAKRHAGDNLAREDLALEEREAFSRSHIKPATG